MTLPMAYLSRTSAHFLPTMSASCACVGATVPYGVAPPWADSPRAAATDELQHPMAAHGGAAAAAGAGGLPGARPLRCAALPKHLQICTYAASK